ncbi:MMPL family transporter [Nocardioides sp. YIM 152315]|uniref:MMPL family transporter n=1 Tax=Nocardioides sp. YIM 152315 TaxID=3031760 RepID=UPI0023DCC3DD|nr:MMPL family transporter [Nocardioides sp. YIM 152315]MDF1603974.1 MMPL family transporter [Nocardioides sp. YIM 152315]
MHRQIAGSLTGRVTKWIVLVAVLVVAGIMGSFAGKLTDVQENDAESWLPASAESTKAMDELESFVDPYDVGTTIVYYKASGLTDDDLAAIEEQAAELDEIDGVTDVVSPQRATAAGVPAPFVSDDGQIAKMEFTVNYGDALWEELPGVADDIRDLTAIDGVEVYLAGAGGTTADQSSVFSGFDGKLLMITLAAVILILLVSYRSPILWALPIFSAVVGLGITMGLLYLLAKHTPLTINGQTQFILTVLVIGAGTDYALLLIARYREELRRHEDRHEAMAFALHRAAPAILASASTVVIGLLCLMFAELNSTAGLGPANAIGVAVTYVVMVTLLPALLVICGRWVFWPFIPRFGSVEPTNSGFWARVGNRISVRPRAVWLVTSGALVALAFGSLLLDTSGIPSDEQYTKEVDSVVGQELLVEHGLVDASTPIQVVANADEADAVIESMQDIDGIEVAPEPLVEGDTALIVANLDSDPLSDGAVQAVRDARDAVHQVEGADALVTGWTAVTIDIEEASARDNKVIIPIMLAAVLLILIGLLRALLSPILLIGTVILSFAAALGISGLIFSLVYDRPHTDPGFPLYAFVFLVALGIDYNIFLMTRVREETAAHGTRRGSLIALSSTGGVITAAGLVLAATFGALATMPLTFTLQIGTTIALGVLLDTMIVRSVLVTAINLDLGGRIWWPSALDRKPPVAPTYTAEQDEQGEPDEPEVVRV